MRSRRRGPIPGAKPKPAFTGMGWYCHFTLLWPNDPSKKSEYKCDHVPTNSLSKLADNLKVFGSYLDNTLKCDLKNHHTITVDNKENGARLHVVITQNKDINFDHLHAPVADAPPAE